MKVRESSVFGHYDILRNIYVGLVISSYTYISAGKSIHELIPKITKSITYYESNTYVFTPYSHKVVYVNE